MFRCRVILLDDTHIERDLEKNAVGQVLFDYVCDHLNLLERGYFGLAAWDSSNNRVWLDFSREVHKQIINHDATFTFNIKFYPPDPSLLAEDLTRYLLCLQVRTDIMTNRLPCPLDMLTVLGSYIVQSEFGDYDPDVHGPGYLSTIALAPNQTPELEESVTELHRTYNSMTPAQADENFLQNAMMLPFYGVDQHPAKDVNGADVMLGVSADGIVVYEGKTQTQSFPWPRVLKISYIRNKFQLRIRHTQDATESTFNYILSSYRASKRLWKVAVENHAFFRNHRQDKYEGLVQLGSRFRFRRNTHTETLETSSNIKRPGPPIAHCAIKKKGLHESAEKMKKAYMFTYTHSLSQDLDVTQEVVLKHHASVRELKRIFMEDVPVSGPTEWDKRLSTHSTGHIPQVTDGQYIITMDTVSLTHLISCFMLLHNAYSAYNAYNAVALTPYTISWLI
uniref:Protein 4.1 n=1 Tax=Pygocentrus nattereri TaxID=42514 RepID=A0AAR2KYM1_PYGNA